MLLEAGDELFALPTAAVRRILHVSRRRHRASYNRDRSRIVDGETIPLTSLSTLLHVPAAPPTPTRRYWWLKGSDGRFGLIVDAVHEEQELVFKELRGPLRDQKTFTGAALLGNGDIVPILDVNALFELASRRPSHGAATAAERRAPSPRSPRARRRRFARRRRAAEEHSPGRRLRGGDRELTASKRSRSCTVSRGIW